MRAGLAILGNALMTLGGVGLLVLGIFTAALYVWPPSATEQAARTWSTATLPQGLAPEAEIDAANDDNKKQAAALADPASLAITWLRIASIQLDTEVVPAKFAEDSGSWEVPPFKAGHAEFTAGAGQRGNAVLFGHVTSLTLGNVFQELERVRVGDRIEVGSGADDFIYQVAEVRVVPRTEVSVIEPTKNASISLITCTGRWLPQVRDYADRLVVRGEFAERLAQSNDPGRQLLAADVDGAVEAAAFEDDVSDQSAGDVADLRSAGGPEDLSEDEKPAGVEDRSDG